MGKISANAGIEKVLAHGVVHYTDNFHDSFSSWLKGRLAANLQYSILPCSVGGLRWRLDKRGICVSEVLLSQIEDGKIQPDWQLTYEIGAILHDAVGALYSRGFMARMDNLPKPLSADGFVSIGVLGLASASQTPRYSGDAAAMHNTLLPRSCHLADLFSVIVYGNCLEGLHIAHLDVMVCRYSNTANNMDIVAVQEPGTESAFTKRYREADGRRWLETVPANGLPERVEIWDSQIVGVMVSLIRNV